MSKKIISSKETYFKRQNNPMTLEDWNNFKLANPRPEYLGETCWSLHDSMILRGKPADDSAIVKTLLRKVGIEFEQHVDYLKITSDLTDEDILVVEIECDELLEQLSAAGARVLYITSNVNYGIKVPEKYFEMYADGAYNTNDYPATDKRNMFTNKNVIVKYINFNDYKKKGLYSIFLQNTLKEYNMKINKVLMNPPYDGSLHLEVLEATLRAARETNTESELVSIQPVRWLEDPLAEYKQGSDYKKYKDTIVDKISSLKLIDSDTCNSAFNITNRTDLGIFVFNVRKTVNNISIYSDIAARCITKILSKIKVSLADKIESMKSDGWRTEIKKIAAGAAGSHAGNDITTKQGLVIIVPVKAEGVFKDGYDKDGLRWFENRQGNGQEKSIALPNSIKFETELEARNLNKICKGLFMKNWLSLIKWDVNVPLRFIPYLPTYDHVWTDEELCFYFGLDQEESEFMCRKVDDYRVKDFINYINLDEE